MALLVWNAFEVVETEVERGFRGEAARDPLLAAQRLIEAMEVPAERLRGTQRLPPTDHVLLYLADVSEQWSDDERDWRRFWLGGREMAGLLAWVEAGGHLVTTPEMHLAGNLGATVVFLEAVPEKAQLLELGPARSYAARLAARARLADTGEKAELAAGPEDGRLLLRYRHGRGLVTLLADSGFLENDQIGEHDHASFFWAVVASGGRPAGVHFLRSLAPPRLSTLAVRHLWPALVAGATLLAGWAWRRAARFGPMLPDPPRSRRSLVEHVRAVGDFLWRHGRAEELLASARRSVERAASRFHPGWERLPERERVDRLARAAGLPGAAVAAALAREPSGRLDAGSFARAIQVLEQVRRSL